MGQQLAGTMGKCQIGERTNQLDFSFIGIERPDLTNIFFTFTNFKNPWSSVTMNSVRVDSYNSPNCEGNGQTIQRASSLAFYSEITPYANVKISSSSNILGDSDPATEVTFEITPAFTTSKTGSGEFSILFPSWFEQIGKTNMMYNERDKDFCRSEAFELVTSRADLISQRLKISYINMKQEFITGRTFTIICRGFRNPIYQAQWKGFMLTMYDQEDPPNAIETTGRDLTFDSNGFLPAKISLQGMRI